MTREASFTSLSASSTDRPRRLPRLFGRVLVLAAVLVAGTVPAAAAASPASGGPATLLVGYAGNAPAAPGDTLHGASVAADNAAAGFLTVRATDAAGFEQRAQHDPKITFVEVDELAFEPTAVPNDPYHSYQWALGPSPGVDAYTAWDPTWGSNSVRVAVLDTGVDASHADLPSAVAAYDFVNKDGVPEDNCGHGTMVAGIVAASSNNGRGVAGTSQSGLMVGKVMEATSYGCTGAFSAVANGITWAVDNGADVVSMSLGCQGCYSTAVDNAMAYATSKGVLVVVSAGNGDGQPVAFPANDPDAMAVTAINDDGSSPAFVSVGPEVEIAAPGSSVLTTKVGGSYAYFGGTSAAAPNVAGVAALVLSVSDMDGAALRAHLKATAVDQGLSASRQGAGAVNAANAVAEAGSGPTPEPEPVNGAPAAAFTYSCSDLACTFDGSGSSDPDGDALSYTWTFGDGSSATGAKPDHTYAKGGSYSVKLTVTDPAGATGSKTRTVTVTEPVTNAPPSASFKSSCTDLSCAFDGSGSSDPDGDALSYQWSFGDGASASGVAPGHSYGADGTYTVTLTVTDPSGASDSTSQTVTVSAPAPEPTPEPSPSTSTMHVHGIDQGKKGPHLWATVWIADAAEAPVAGATVSVSICDASGQCISETGTTADDGSVDFRWHKAGKGTYTTCVTALSAAGYEWDAAADHASGGSCLTSRV